MTAGSLRVRAFFGALLVYALFGTPTPDQPGWAEYLVMAGLLAAMGAGGLLQAAHIRIMPVEPIWMRPARLLLLYGLTVPLCAGLWQGHPVSLIMRDVIPFLFLLLPLFLPMAFLERPSVSRALPWLLCLIGAVFVMRVMAGFLFHIGSGAFPLGYVPDPGNLVNAPTVLFAALFLTGTGGLNLTGAGAGRARAMIASVSCFALTLFLLAGMAGIGQRAHIGAWVLTVLLWLALLLVRKPRALLLPSLFALAALMLLWPFAQEIFAGLAQKNSVVGLNNRAEEARAVWESFRANPSALLWGQGWGATIVSPAVGPDPVNYTHNLFTTYLLKGGLPAVALVLLYLGTLGAGIWRIFRVYPVGALALAAPFLIDITLYASFKSLDFGLLLALIALWTRWPLPPDKVASTAAAGV